MTKINHFIQDIIPPYSPGAVYHELKLLEKANMIKINQSGLITITPQGLDLLHYDLLERPLPKPLFSRLVKILALLSLADSTKRATGLHKIQIEMIKNSHLLPKNERAAVDKNAETINELPLMRQSLQKAILSFIAQI
jgi:DNA-binding PadR family transcriptional regulator